MPLLPLRPVAHALCCPPPRVCSKLDINRQTQVETTATGIKGSIPESWSGMTELRTL